MTSLRRRQAAVSLISFALLAIAATLSFSFFFEPASLKLGSQFEAVPIEVADYDINDIGVTDVNQDGNLDIFTTNHSAQQSLLLGDGSGGFVDVLVASGLSQDRQFPRLENSARSPEMSTPGFYIYRQRNLLHLAAKDTEALGNVSGSIELSANAQLVEQSQAEVEIERTVLSSGLTTSRIQFDLSPGGSVEIESKDSNGKKIVVEIPHQVRVDDTLPLSAIFVGRDALTPDSYDFELMWRDRHSMVWSDVNNDGQRDIFVGRGGIHGKMRLFPEQYYDELFINQSGTGQTVSQTVRQTVGQSVSQNVGHNAVDRGDISQSRISQSDIGPEKSPEKSFADQTLQFGLIKDDCSARQSAWVDFDNDGLLDIFNSCGRNASDNVERPHQLFHHRPDGTFEEIAQAVNLDLPRAGEFIWFDADGDNRLDVVATQDRKLVIYYNQGDTFTAQPLGRMADPRNKQFTAADFDQDGSTDIYVAGKVKSYLLQKQGDRYQMNDPTEKGLPGYSLCANWVDYDNDGYSDLHVIPGGLYRQQPDHTFRRAQLLSSEAAVFRERLSRLVGRQRMKYQRARCSWFDYDNDGFRDFIMAQRQDSPFSRLVHRFAGWDSNKQWQVHLVRNKAGRAQSHWLSLVLKGVDGNREAIGASVSLETPEGTQTQRVGSSEGAYFSQGHYRVYFGLGNHSQADTVSVKWPNGESQTLRNVAADQQITIEQSAPSA